MSSILTNNSAMVALQTLKSNNSNQSTTQSQISTGKEIGSAKDNAAVWAVSKVMESDVAGFDAVQDSLSVGASTVAVASAGAEQIVETLKEMKQLAVSAQSQTADFGKIQTEMAAKRDQIDSVIGGSQFNGVNLLASDVDGAAVAAVAGTAGTPTAAPVPGTPASGGGGALLSIVSSLNRVGGTAPDAAKIDVYTVDFEAQLGTVTEISDTATAATALGEIEAMLTTAINGAASLGSSGKRIDDQSNFVSKMKDVLTSGIGALVDTDMEAASAKLQALQTQQQLGVQALSIANQAPQSILSLFR
jgi:flagellin